jgi:uncharacterized SAM-binding protein YcdF (DUF218 family)
VFWLKKVISFYLMPLPLCLALMALGLFLSRPGRRPRLGRILVLASAALLFLFSNGLVSNCLVDPLESRFPAIPEIAEGGPPPAALAGCQVVAVLGGGHSDMPGKSATSQLSPSALARIVEAVRILRCLPDARLIVSGPGAKGRPTHASVLARAAVSLGVSPSRITQIDTALDTEDESREFARLAGTSRVALVTSAWHMPRAALLFRSAGVDFVACPADFVGRDKVRLEWSDLSWDSDSLDRSTRAVHEWIGILWLRLRGRA